ncbi:MAG: aspartate aminotransferase family protein [Lachnospiraceae bacterium]|nr:aspartate aminotransferase family protein [Lachnospiraceae bacterium]
MITKFKTNQEVIENGDKYLYPNHVRMPIALEGGDGAWVFDKDGNKYLDFVGGIAVNGLGHNHPRIQECLAERAKTILHCSNYFYNEPAVQTAKLIVENSCFDRVLFANSGAEANEGQIKLARKYAKDHGHPERFVVITMKNSFHGRTLATCTATGQYGVHRYFEPLPDGFRYATFNDLDSVKALVDEYTCAILTEPVQGEGGVRPATPEFLKGLRELCDEKGILLMFDEVQVGSGRTGKLFAHQYYGVEPDTCSMAKALGSGVPIAALCARGDAARTLTPGTHGSTFAGGPLACALAMTTLDVMLNEGVLENCAEVGEYFRQRAHEVIEKNHPDTVDEIRGLGLINGIQLKKESGQPVVDLCYKDNNVLINNTNGNVLRFIPPLIVTKEEVDIVIAAVDAAMTKLGW